MKSSFVWEGVRYSRLSDRGRAARAHMLAERHGNTSWSIGLATGLALLAIPTQIYG